MWTVTFNPYQGTGVYADAINELVKYPFSFNEDGLDHSRDVFSSTTLNKKYPVLLCLYLNRQGDEANITASVKGFDINGKGGHVTIHQEQVKIGDIYEALDRLNTYLESLG